MGLMAPSQGNISDEADDRLVQARVSAQARSHAQSAASLPSATTATDNYNNNDDDDTGDVTKAATLPALFSRSKITPATRQAQAGNAVEESSPPPAPPPPTLPPTIALPVTSSPSSTRDNGNAVVSPPSAVLPTRNPNSSRVKGRSVDGRGRGGKATDSSGTSSSSHRGASISSHSVLASIGGGGGGAGTSTGGGSGGGGKGVIGGDVLTVLSVTANGDGWSEAVGAALATRARAGYVFAQEADPDSPQSSEFLREVFTEERSGARKVSC